MFKMDQEILAKVSTFELSRKPAQMLWQLRQELQCCQAHYAQLCVCVCVRARVCVCICFR